MVLKRHIKTIKGSLKYACYTVNFINDNPAERVHIPRYKVVCGDQAHIFTQEEIERILDRFKDVHYIYYSFLTAYYTGLRVSEVFGLTWDCIDFEKKTLTVNKNIIKKNKEGLPKKYVISKGHSVENWFYGSCKNPQSNRTISIGDTLVKALKEYKKEQEEYKKFYGDSYLKHYEKKVINEYTKREEIKIVDAKAELELNFKEAQLIFVKPNGQFRGTETVRYAFKVINYELGIPCRFHDFRDTHATRLIENGADIKAVSKRLGHSTIQTTYNIYVRVTEKMETDTVDRFENYTNSLGIPKIEKINKFLCKNENLREISDKELREFIQDIHPHSDWERFFSKKGFSEDFENIIKDINLLRNSVAHNKIFTKDMYNNLVNLLKLANKDINRAIKITENEDFRKINEEQFDDLMHEISLSFRKFTQTMLENINYMMENSILKQLKEMVNNKF